ncbi:MAG: potassium channel family protein [Kineosporiaceae bacterium]
MTTTGAQPATVRARGAWSGRRRQAVRTGLVSAAHVAVVIGLLLVVYAEAPWDRLVDRAALGWFVVWFAVLVAAVGWQIRSVMRSTHPWSRAAEAAVLSVALLLVPFATGYAVASHADPATFTQPLTRTDAMYFTVTVFATVGFGDIAPVTETARIAVTFQMLTDLLLIGVIVKVLIGAAQYRRATLENEANGAGPAAAVPDVADRARPDPP